MSERGDYVLMRQGWCLIESKNRNTARTDPKNRKASRNPERPLGLLAASLCKALLFIFLLTNFLCFLVDGGWLPITLSFASKF